MDFHGLDEAQLQDRYPALYQRAYDLIRPARLQNRDRQRRDRWWLFGRSNEAMRTALEGLRRFIVTVETSKFKVFVFVDASVCPDHKLYAVASDDAWMLGVLSSRAHLRWALSAGGHLGVGNDPTWTNTTCFLPFPFPACSPAAAARIRRIGEQLDAHRKARQAAHPDLTITGMYNILEKLRAGEALSDKEAAVHEKGLVSVLQKIHDDLDAAVFEAYGWPASLTDEQILERLVALNAERALEEKQGILRWLRPDFQNPSGQRAAVQASLAGTENEEEGGEAGPERAAGSPWPKKMPEQIAAVRELLTGSTGLWTAERVAAGFIGAKPADVAPVLESLAMLGLLLTFEDDDGPRWKAVAVTSA